MMNKNLKTNLTTPIERLTLGAIYIDCTHRLYLRNYSSLRLPLEAHSSIILQEIEYHAKL